MKRRTFLLASASSLFGSRASHSAFGIFQTYAASCSPSMTKNMVADYGFDNTGATNNLNTYFTTVKSDMTGQNCVVLNYLSGTYKFTGFFSALGVPNCGDLTINLGTATINDGGSGGAGGDGQGPAFLWSSGHEGQIGIDRTTGTAAGFSTAGGQSARIQTVSAGATSVTLTAASASAGHISRFNAGQYIMVVGWATQGTFQGGYSFPNNFHWHDYVKITSIVGNTINFAGQPLVYFYDQNWPELNRGTAVEIEAAGPATIFAMSLDWDGTTTVNDGTLDITPGGSSTFVNNCRRVFTVNNTLQLGKTFYPSMNQTFRAVNASAPNVLVEHDKNNDLVDIQGGTYRNWKVQSSSTKLLKLTGVTLTNQMQGTGRIAEIDSCDIQGPMVIGPLSYGRGETLKMVNSTISGALTGGILIQGTRFQNQGLQEALSMTSGLLTIPMCLADAVLPYVMPDASGRHVLFWSGNIGTFGAFKCLSATSDTWPAVDNQTTTVGISTTNGSRTLTVDTPTFVAGDVGKVLLLPGVMAGTGDGFTGCTITNATPGVVTSANHGLVLNDPVRFQTSIPGSAVGTLPSEYSAGVTYYVVSANLAANTFSVSATVGGAAIATSGGSGTVYRSYSSNIYTFITGYTNSTTVTVFDSLTHYSMTSVSRALQWGTCNAYIQTDQPGGMPTSTMYPSGKLNLLVPPGRSVYFENVTGTNQVVDLSQAAARNRPFGSYTKRPYNGQTGFTASNGTGTGVFGPNISMTGNVVSLEVDVTTAYTGVSALSLVFEIRYRTGDYITGTFPFYAGTIDLKTTGKRTMLINGVTTGKQTNDTNLNWPATAWLCGTTIPKMSRDITGESAGVAPVFTVELITDQGFA